eukprot:GFUD01064139.1.p1 GENE.GFUD01064139.1~~GFUD01064139.1.p1  ORF type:complete len:365 (+),score=90.31 GFUD01064139.1:146-1240(+)
MATSTKFIPLAPELVPKNAEKLNTASQAEVLEKFSRTEDAVGTKTATLGAKGNVCFEQDKGFYSTVLKAYNNHWVLKTSPEDWWFCITQKIAMAIDKNAKKTEVRQFFVEHEGKKTLTVSVGSSIYGVNYSWFFDQMAKEIEKNINVPEYVNIMDTDFSESSSVHRIVNKVVLMASMQEYFEYRRMLGCGIPGVLMQGKEEDWKHLLLKLNKLRSLLQPIDHHLGLSGWWDGCADVCTKLIQTYQGTPDQDWWSRIITKERFGSGGQCVLKGWFGSKFLGISYDDIKSGLVAVPMKITDGFKEEEAAVVAGIAGYKFNEQEVPSNKSGGFYPSVEAVHTWALMMEPGAAFRCDLVTWQEKNIGA